MQNIRFIGSFPNYQSCPQVELPQYCFVGRSNVGKSSLINALAGHKKLAKTSKTPGKTQLINFFEVDESWYLVDLPGYGYAKESKKKRKKWEMMVRNYLQHTSSVVVAFILLDSNIPLQKRDLDFINWMGEKDLPFVLVFTKIDRHRRVGEREEKVATVKNGLLEYWTHLPDTFEVSSKTGEGKQEILDYIDQLNNSIQITRNK